MPFFLFLALQLLLQGLVLSDEVVESNQKFLIFFFSFLSSLPFLPQHALILNDECLFLPLEF